MQCNTEKQLLRSKMKKRRRELGVTEISKKSTAICNAFLDTLLFSAAKTVCVYMSAFGEPDTEAIINVCIASGKEITVPVVDGDDIFPCLFSEKLCTGAFGIREPAERIITDKNKIDLFIVPALAFDVHGVRVGFGKGYYDKLLCGTKAVKVGLLYDFQLVRQIAAAEHDINMDYLITESRVIDCASEI